MSNQAHVALTRFVDRLLLRSPLTDEEVNLLLSINCEVKQYRAHRDIVSIGRPVDVACLVSTGMAARFDQLANGQRQLAAIYIQGDMCDLHSVAVPLPGWGIQAITRTEIVQVPHKDLKALTIQFPNIAYAFWRDTIADGSVMAKWLSVLGQRVSVARLAHFLCEIGLRMEQANLGTRFEFSLSLTQSQLADLLGMTPVHVNRVFQKLRDDGAIRTDGSEVSVRNYDRLLLVAEFDPAYLLISELRAPATSPGPAIRPAF